MAEFADGEAVRRALQGAATVLMVSASETPDRVAAASELRGRRRGGRGRPSRLHVVRGRRARCGRSRWPATTGPPRNTSGRAGWDTRFLRDNLYADFLPFMVGEDGVIRGPAGDGRAAVVAQDDIADAAVAVLREPSAHAGRTYDLTGPAALTLAEIAATITAVTGRDGHLSRRDVARGVRVAGGLRCAGLAGGRLGEHVHVDRRGRTVRGQQRRADPVARHVATVPPPAEARRPGPARTARPLPPLARWPASRGRGAGCGRAGGDGETQAAQSVAGPNGGKRLQRSSGRKRSAGLPEVLVGLVHLAQDGRDVVGELQSG